MGYVCQKSDAWAKIVATLDRPNDVDRFTPIGQIVGKNLGATEQFNTKGSVTYDVMRVVKIVDRPSQGTLLVSWSDAQKCVYLEQTWKLRVANKRGRCVLSGREIQIGSSVFVPFCRPRPLNAGAMIIEEVAPIFFHASKA
ncbi:DUF3331 domain-containing protein [Burkholderia vietnamiensis]|jgi:hypothetical protein|uniref:DUF3331 domain-containing protein n=3 Tax=Burkholderia cepacia complex TaxID=87882 RepID=A0A0H3KYU0_BURM1|nr:MULTISPECIES: DUF3331 domain-containing protein [Burkholderia cepacia complex]ABX19433.1 conserved hypothetical protein [Burkholderia multivorans ATCC 17616]AXK68200.1 DUF3331 domain-containing protein [Burkholderia sp. IDO3]OXI39416.1 hypothetical protein CFB84_27415 [Burkholderia aenigmatica]AIO71739.1 hypothetical protein DM80_6216 [Burkholderia multivorans]MBH9648465.1 DUF3331 domain-containing protein [Burkholderia vietnamiensis]